VAGTARVVLASNRGPVSFTEDSAGRLVLQRGGGGLVSGLRTAARDSDAMWVCAALGDADRRAVREAGDEGRIDVAGHDTEGARVRMLGIDPTTYHRAYNAVANRTLWFLHHLLFDVASAPVFDERFRREWAAYVEYDEAFAIALAEEAAPGAVVAVQDYHLSLTPRMLRARRPNLHIGHFSHTPWAPASYFSLLPDDIARDVLTGLLAADAVGFLCRRWADAFIDCCAAVLGARVDAGTVTHEGRVTRVEVHSLGVDPVELRRRAAQPDVAARKAALAEMIGDRRLLLRIDRTEMSKNIVRGLAAYRELLRTRPEWHGRVMHLAFAYPSRHDLPEYREYTAAVQEMAEEIEDEFATPHWAPLVLEVNDDYARSLAAYCLADVLVVNPIRDGMNLVAKEGVVLSERELALVLSREAGAADELGSGALVINPYDVSGTAAAMHAALVMPPAERATRRRRLVAGATAVSPREWLARQLRSLTD
jgi:trehalose 6-phosphate synthase